MRKGAVAAPSPILEQRNPLDITPETGGVALLVLLAGLFVLALSRWRHGHDQASLNAHYYESREPRSRRFLGGDPVVARLDPPEGLRPAEAGVLLDGRANNKDVTATIVDLAGRGFLRIDPLPDEDWRLTWTRTSAGGMEELRLYERHLLERLFRGRASTTLSALRGDFSADLAAVENLLRQHAVDAGWFNRNRRSGRVVLAGLALLLVGSAAAVVLGRAEGWGLPGAALAFVGLAWLIGGHYMPLRTPEGSQLLQQVLGFRLYMRTAEVDRQQLAEKENRFTAFLPYAIVFGCVERWARAFEGLAGRAPQTGWYGPGDQQPQQMSRSLETFNSHVGSALSDVPSASGGSDSGFSGGFSGGGGGGGGAEAGRRSMRLVVCGRSAPSSRLSTSSSWRDRFGAWAFTPRPRGAPRPGRR